MNYQRKSIVFVLFVYFALAVFELFNNGALFFYTPFNNIVLFFISSFFFLKSFKKAVLLERIGLFGILCYSLMRLIDDPYFLITFFEHERIHAWRQSFTFLVLETIGYLMLFMSIFVLAFLVKPIQNLFSWLFAGLGLLLISLGFIDIPMEPFFAFAAVATCAIVLLNTHFDKLSESITALCTIWIILAILSLFELWNTSL